MEKKLLIVINKTNQQYQFVNKECANDNKQIAPNASSTLPSINLTQGQHAAGCDIPDCSDKKYYADHHMGFVSPENNASICFWYDDSKLQYYYTTSDSFDSSKVIPGNVSNSAPQKALYIMEDGTLLLSDIF